MAGSETVRCAMATTSYSFGEYRVDPAARELWCGGRLVALPPQVFDCLAYLIEHHDRAVGRDELVAAVWGKTEVSDTLIGQTVMRIRRELGDDGKEQRTVRTIPRFGFRWIAPLEGVTDGNPLESIRRPDPAATSEVGNLPVTEEFGFHQAEIPSDPRIDVKNSLDRGRIRHLIWLLPVLTIVALTFFLLRGSMETHSPTHEALNESAAAIVLTGVEPGTDPQWSWLRFGVTDVVASRLRSSGLPTAPSENVIALLNAQPTTEPAQLRQAGGFGLIVTPRVRESGSGWEVHLNAEDGANLKVVVSAQAKDATEAARLAADKLLVVLGRDAPSGSVENEAQAQWIKQIDAAVLADDPATARALIQRASVSLQRSPGLGLRLAKIDFRIGHMEAARDRLTALLDLASAQTEPVLRAGILNGLGAVAIRSEHLALAGKYFSEAVDLLVARNDPAQLGEAYLGRAAASVERREFESAMVDFARARVALKQANDTLALLRVSANEGFVDLELARPAQALPQLIGASAGFEKWGAINEAILTRIGQIDAYLALLQIDKAVLAADAATLLSVRIDSTVTLDSLALARSRALAAAGRLREAREILMRLRGRTPAPDPSTALIAAVQLSRIELDNGDPEQALELITTDALRLAQPNQISTRTSASKVQVDALARLGRREEAMAALGAFESWANKPPDVHSRMFAELARAEVDWRFGAADQDEAFATASRTAEASAVPSDIAVVAAAYADALLAEGKLDQAEVEVGRLSRWSESDFTCAIMEARLYAALGRDEARQTALSRARALAGERSIPADAARIPISTQAASSR